ncbi:MAG TPA: hypothetical protein VIK89_11075 [Cytophagaceae bacterium]
MMLKKLAIPITLLLLIAGLCLLYLATLREMVVDLYHGQAPVWLNDVVIKLYPRFDVEKYRFDLTFFLNKADQVIIRSTVVSVLAISFYLAIQLSNNISTKITTYWNSTIPASRVRYLRIITAILFIYFSWEILWDMEKLIAIKAFYNPIPLYKILHIPFPSYTGIIIIYSVLMLSAVCLLLNYFPVATSSIAALLFILVQGYYFSFEKVDHGYSTFMYAAMVFPFLLAEYNKAKTMGDAHQKGWPLQLILVLISLVYFLSGMEKLTISGLNWIDAVTFKTFLLLHEAPVGMAVAKIDWLCILLPACALLFQLSFFLNLVLTKYRWLFLLIGISFHWGTVLLFGISSYINPWILVYAMFIEWEKVAAMLAQKLTFRFLQK